MVNDGSVRRIFSILFTSITTLTLTAFITAFTMEFISCSSKEIISNSFGTYSVYHFNFSYCREDRAKGAWILNVCR